MQQDDEKETQEQAAAETVSQEGAELDLDALDLTVETIEERISPSETNVFDK